MKKYSSVLGVAFILTGLIGTQVFAEEAGVDIMADDEDIVVETIEIIEDNPTDDPLPENVVLTTPEGDEVATSDEDTPLEEEDETVFTIEADLSGEDETSTLVIETIDTDAITGEALTIDENALTSEVSSDTDSAETLATTTITFQLETFKGALYNDTFILTECANDADGTTTTLNIWCAIQQLGVQENWLVSESWGPYGVTYDIDEYKGTDFSDGRWWGWHTNGTSGGTGVNVHELTEGEHILLTYGIEPTQLFISSSSPALGETVDISYLSFDWSVYDWAPTPSSTFVINDVEYIDADGTYELSITTTTPYSVYASKDGYITSELAAITPYAPVEDTTPSDPEDNDGTNTNTSSDGNTPTQTETLNFSPTDAEIQAAADALMAYMKTQQSDDGSFIDGGTTDWLIMSLSAYGDNPSDIAIASSSSMDYAFAYDLSGFTSLNDCASYPLHILALLAGGVDTADASIAELETHMSTYCHTNNTYGLDTLNDDMFAILALLATGHTGDEEMIMDLVDTIETSQTETGMFAWPWGGGTDLTGLALNSLVYAQENGVVIDQAIIDNSKQFLKDTQLADGGWGDYGTTDLLTTSWVMMGINTLGESQDEWINVEGYTPWNALVSAVNADGYYESAWTPGPDWFSMKHSVPALLGASWPIIGTFVDAEMPSNENNSPGSGNNGSKENTLTSPTTTTDITTTTLEIREDVVTSTEDIILEETSTTTAATPVLRETIVETAKPLAIGGGPDEFVHVEPAVAGVKIAELPVFLEEDMEIVDDAVILEAEDPVEQEEAADESEDYAFKFSLGITLFLAGLLGWRLLKSLL